MPDSLFPTDATPRRAPGLEQNDLRDGTIIFDPVRQIAHHLNPVAMLVWELLDGRSLEQIASTVAKVLECEADEADDYTRAALAGFREQQLLS